MTPDQIHPGHTYQRIANPDCRVLAIDGDSVTYRDRYGVAESEIAEFASACVRDFTPAPESDQGEKVAQAQSQGASSGDGYRLVRKFATDVAEYLYDAGHRDDGPSSSDGTRLLRQAREIAQQADTPPAAAIVDPEQSQAVSCGDGGECLPCPWCGMGDVMVGFEPVDSGEWWEVICGRCDIEGPGENTREAAIARWNRRTPHAADAVNAELLESLRDFVETVERVDAGVYRDCVDAARAAIARAEAGE